MCSSKCEMPACEAGSHVDPVPTRAPIATERTPGMRSVTTFTPLGSVVRACSGSGLIALPPLSSDALSAISPRPVTRTARAALAAAPFGAAVARGAALAVTPATSATGATTSAGADACQLLDGLAGHVRVLREAQADA